MSKICTSEQAQMHLNELLADDMLLCMRALHERVAMQIHLHRTNVPAVLILGLASEHGVTQHDCPAKDDLGCYVQTSIGSHLRAPFICTVIT